MEITFVLPGISINGGVRVVFQHAKNLAEKGHTVNIVHPFFPPSLISKSIVHSLWKISSSSLLRLFNRGMPDWNHLNTNLIRIPSLNPKISFFFEYLIPDADVIIATSWQTAYFVNKLDSKKGDKYYFIQHYEIWELWNDFQCWEKTYELKHNDENEAFLMYYIKPESAYLQRLKDKVDQTYLMALKKITISSWLKRLIEESFGQQVVGLLPDFIDTNKFYFEKDKDWSAKKFTILMPYRGIKWKGEINGLKSLEIVHNRYNDSIDVIFFGPNKPKRLPPWISFYKTPSDDELRNLYNKAHIFVFPSWVEGWGLPPMEAMACKCAVVTTDVGGVPEYATNNQTALVVEPRNTKMLSEAIIRLLDNKQMAKKIAENAYLKIKAINKKSKNQSLEQLLK
jgi:hypothetical protein